MNGADSTGGVGRRVLILLLLLLAAAAAGLWLASPGAAGGASSLAGGGAGWRAARAYLETRGSAVEVLDRPVAAGEADAVVVTAFPWRTRQLEHESGLEEHLRRGGTLLVAYSGQRWQEPEEAFFDRLGIELRSLRPDPPLNPGRWRRFVEREWQLVPVGSLGAATGPGPTLRALDLAPEPPDGARILYRAPAGETNDEPPDTLAGSTGGDGETPALVFEAEVSGGRLLVLPAEMLSNGRLGQRANADFLETLRVGLGDRWVFDERAQGLLPPVAAAAPPPSFDLLGAHLVLLYGLALAALARRFGPPWRARRERAGSAAGLLRGLGGLHHDLGHHAAAAPLLLARRRELAPRIDFPASFDRRAEADPSPRELVELAADLAAFAARPGAVGADPAEPRTLAASPPGPRGSFSTQDPASPRGIS